jgi:HlyD family secretion protein
MRRWIPAAALMLVTALAACTATEDVPVTETVAIRAIELSVRGQGQLKPAKATPLMVPGENWAPRQLVWMLPEGSVVHKGDLLARFTSDQGRLQLGQALIDLKRNALAREANTQALGATQGRLDVDLAKVAVDLDIAQRYAHADVSTLARNDVLDAVQDVRYLDTRRDTLQWKRGQSSRRGQAELAVLDAQRATYGITAQQRHADLDALELRAPNDGVMMLSADWTGEKPAVGSNLNAGGEFGSLPDPAAMEAELTVPEIEAQGIATGDTVELHPSGHPEEPIRSRISWVSPTAKVRSNESPVKYVSLKASIPPAAVRGFRLVPAQGVDARIILLRSARAISVANLAVRGDDGQTFVEVRDGRGVERRTVRLGVRGPARSQVLAGLHDGDEVLLTPATPVQPAASKDVAAGRSAAGAAR